MKRTIVALGLCLLLCRAAAAQVLITDFVVNDPSQNAQGLGRTAVAATADGDFAVAWQDFNTYGSTVTAIPRIAVQLFDADASTFGSLNLFNGESRGGSIWTSDFLRPNADLAFTPTGTLLVAFEHHGLFFTGVTDLEASEVGWGAVQNGQIIDVNPGSTAINYWYALPELEDERNPRLAMTPSGVFFLAFDGPSFATEYSAVGVQQFDGTGAEVGSAFTPHAGDPGPNFHHQFPDVATNGSLLLVAWEDGRQDANFDIGAQFYDLNGAVGGNLTVNAGDPAGTINVVPSAAMAPTGNNVVVWVDSRSGAEGEVWGQRFDASGQPVGGNFQVSNDGETLWDRPEVAMLDDGQFIVVWTINLDPASGGTLDSLRARGRVFDAASNPLGPAFTVPDQDVGSGGVNAATDGAAYYLSWIDERTGGLGNAYFKKLGPAGPGGTDGDGDGFTVMQGDCDDTDVTSYPGAAEQCDGNDNACSGGVPADETDADGDGYVECAPWLDTQGDQPQIQGGGDCNDTSGAISPVAAEACSNAIDDDCDGQTDEDCTAVVLGNVSTRGLVGTGDDALIGGFIVTGSSSLRVLVRALGPTLGQPPFNVPGALADPQLLLTTQTGTLLASNDDWQTGNSPQEISEIQGSGFAPPAAAEPAIVATLAPGAYTPIVSGVGGGTGVGIVEIYALENGVPARLANVSTRGFVGTGGDQLIGGFIVDGGEPKRVLIRALGPTLGLPPFNVTGAMADPQIVLTTQTGTLIATNDDWQVGNSPAEVAEIQSSGFAPPDPTEPAIVVELAPGSYTPLVSGTDGGTGVGIIEVYELP